MSYANINNFIFVLPSASVHLFCHNKNIIDWLVQKLQKFTFHNYEGYKSEIRICPVLVKVLFFMLQTDDFSLYPLIVGGVRDACGSTNSTYESSTLMT